MNSFQDRHGKYSFASILISTTWAQISSGEAAREIGRLSG
jgi:hypothetical protein